MRYFKSVFKWFTRAEVIVLLFLFSANILPLFSGYKAYTVKSGSMEPAVMTGSLAYVDTDVKSDDIQTGDIIAFNTASGDTVTHRVTEINSTEKNWITRGDANENADFTPVPFDSLTGRTEFSVPYLGYVMQFISETRGKIILAGIFMIQLLVSMIIKNDDTEEKKNEYHEQNQRK